MDDPQSNGPAVSDQLLDIKQAKPMPRQHRLGTENGVVHEMLVVDGVELVSLDQSDEVRDLDRHQPTRPEQGRRPAVKSFRSGMCAKTLFATT